MRISGLERFLGVIGYLPLLGMVIARWVKRDSIFVQFHARQGAVLFALWIVPVIVLIIVLAALGGAAFLVQVLMGLLFVLTLVYLLMMLVGMVKVLMGERYRMPLVADVALKIGL